MKVKANDVQVCPPEKINRTWWKRSVHSQRHATNRLVVSICYSLFWPALSLSYVGYNDLSVSCAPCYQVRLYEVFARHLIYVATQGHAFGNRVAYISSGINCLLSTVYSVDGYLFWRCKAKSRWSCVSEGLGGGSLFRLLLRITGNREVRRRGKIEARCITIVSPCSIKAGLTENIRKIAIDKLRGRCGGPHSY